ncbi:MAG: DUF2064 domain-containing protein [Halanaeroarchaeum sp.]
MTVAVALVDPPREGLVCDDLVEQTPLSAADGAVLYDAMLADFFATMAETNVDLLVNYPAADDLPEGFREGDPEAEIRDVAASVLDDEDLEQVRFEVQVGSNRAARIGNAITHLLRDEGATSAALLDHRTPLLERSVVDEAAINLRRSETVVGPAADGQVYFAGFREPIDFADVFCGSPIENVVERSIDEGHTVDFVRRREVVTHPRDLRTVVSLLRARRAADSRVPSNTMRVVDDLGLRVADGDLFVDGDTTDG